MWVLGGIVNKTFLTVLLEYLMQVTAVLKGFKQCCKETLCCKIQPIQPVYCMITFISCSCFPFPSCSHFPRIKTQDSVSCGQIQLVWMRDKQVCILHEPRKHCFHAFIIQ